MDGRIRVYRTNPEPPRPGIVAAALISPVAVALVIVLVGIGQWLLGPSEDGPLPLSAPEATAEDAPLDPEFARGGAVTITWGGDTTLGSSYGSPPPGAKGMLEGVRALSRDADLSIVNLEGTFGRGGASKCGGSTSGNCFAFQAPPENARELRRVGVDVVSLANNHSNDFGPSGLRQTVSALRRQGIETTGRPGEIAVLERNGLRVAVLGFAPYPWASSLLDLEAARALVRRAGGQADMVIVTAHVGAEGTGALHTPRGSESAFGEPRGNPRAFARAVVGAGADHVLAAGPHVLRGMELVGGRLVAHSLGNLAGWENFSRSGLLSLSGLLEVRAAADGTTLDGTFHSLRLVGPGVPRADAGEDSGRLVSRLSDDDFGDNAVRPGRRGELRLPSE